MNFENYCFVRRNAVHFLRDLPDAGVDAIVTDPPYGIEIRLGTSGGRGIAGDGKAEAKRLWLSVLPELYRVAKPDTAHLFFGTWKSPWMLDVLRSTFDVKGCIVWDKRRIGLGYHLRPRWELAYFCVKGKPARRSNNTPDVWECSRLSRTLHPCEKPVDLLRRAIRLVATPNSLILDPFAGIATTGVAALRENCRFLGSEIDRRHHKLGLRRLDDEPSVS